MPNTTTAAPTATITPRCDAARRFTTRRTVGEIDLAEKERVRRDPCVTHRLGDLRYVGRVARQRGALESEEYRRQRDQG